MKALGGVDRTWSGAWPPEKPAAAPEPPRRHAAIGGRIGLRKPMTAESVDDGARAIEKKQKPAA